MTRPGFASYMRDAIKAGRLVVQPRMGFSRLQAMQEGLRSVKDALRAAPRIGTVTIDAYTRVGQTDLATQALRDDRDLNGFPIVSHGPDATLAMLDGLRDASFPVQVRHGTALPQPVFTAAALAGFDSIEGGPVSYNFPYSRARLAQTTSAWAEAAAFWAGYGERESHEVHIETFAGCMFGQLCPPGMLVALSILEGLFFCSHGIRDISLSLAQGVHDDQDVGALCALARLAERHFRPGAWHVVFYTFMGQFPRSARGAQAIIEASARVAVAGGAHRLIVKTAAEAHGIPTIAQNVDALHWAREAADGCAATISEEAGRWAAAIEQEADALIQATLALAPDWSTRLQKAFTLGVLDIPYCVHPDNRNEARATIDPASNALVWAHIGRMPLAGTGVTGPVAPLNSGQFHDILERNRRRYDAATDHPQRE